MQSLNTLERRCFTLVARVTEPYIFVIDRGGIITAKFEGPVSFAELDAALKQVTS